jgi:hypothetical protein
MPRFILKKDKPWSPYQHSVDRLVKACRDAGYEIDEETAYEAWKRHSEGTAAGWLSMDGYDDGNLVYILNCQCDVVS